ncbi:hypothetical protein LguiB_014451 [Lonicera macranthoides]
MAYHLFDEMHHQNTFCYNAMIREFAIHGQGHEALDLFRKMRIEGFAPDEVTILGVICACSHVGLVDEGCKYFESMADYGLEPKLEHYRAGDKQELLLLSIIYASMNKWEDAKRVRKLMKDNGVYKMPASSIVEINGMMHEFLIGEKYHPNSKERYRGLKR